MNHERDPYARRREVERVFDDMGWENVAEIDEWDGEDLAALRGLLPDEQYQALLDALQDTGEPER